MGTVIAFPGVPPPEDDPLPVGDNAPVGTFDEWYQSEFADWFHSVENMPAEREEFLAALEEVKTRLNSWVVP